MKTKMWLPVLLIAVVPWLFAGEALAQVGFAVEGRVGVTFPTGDLSDEDAEAGLSLGAELQANFHRNLTAFVGFHRYGFACDDGCDLGDPRSTGLAAGLKFIFHHPGDAFLWARGGIVANSLTATGVGNDRTIGFEAGVGADMPVAARLYLVPHLGFVSHGTGNAFTATFMTLGLGVHYHLN